MVYDLYGWLHMLDGQVDLRVDEPPRSNTPKMEQQTNCQYIFQNIFLYILEDIIS